MMARVRGLMAASTAAGSRLKVPGSMSTNTGVPPALWIVPAVAKKVNAGAMTSSPGSRSSAMRGRSNASVPLAHAMPCVAPASWATAASSRGTAGPITNCCDSMTSWMAGRTSSLIARYCATRSRSGTFTLSASGTRDRSSDAVGLSHRPQGAVRLFVGGAADGTRGLAGGDRQPFAALAHPSHAARRHAHHQRVRRDVGRHDRAGADERVLAERDAAQDRGVGADGAAPLHARGAVLVLARHVAPRVQHVGEHARRPAEHIVLQGHAFVDRDVVLDLDVVADARTGHHHHVLAQVAALADYRAGHDVAEVPDLRAPADLRPVVDITRFMDEELRHLGPDHLDLELQIDAGLLGDRLPDVLDELEHVIRRRVAGAHDVVRVQRRDLSAADGEALQPAFVDQSASGPGAPRILENRAGARLVERRSGLAPPQQPRLQFLEFGGRLLDERQLRLDHDHGAEVRGPVLERDLFAQDLPDLPLGIHHGGLREHFRELGPVRARIHVHAAAHRARNPDEALHAREACLGGPTGEERRRQTGAHDGGGTLHFETVETLPDADHDAREAGVLDEI